MKCSIILHFILVVTLVQVLVLGVSSIQKVNAHVCPVGFMEKQSKTAKASLPVIIQPHTLCVFSIYTHHNKDFNL